MKLRDKRLDIVVSIVRAFSVFFFQLLENAVKRLVGWIKSSYDISHALLYNLCKVKLLRSEHEMNMQKYIQWERITRNSSYRHS